MPKRRKKTESRREFAERRVLDSEPLTSKARRKIERAKQVVFDRLTGKNSR
jgi:hypothetical protein